MVPSPNTLRLIKSRRRAIYVARMVEGSSAFKIVTGKPTGKRLLGMPRLRWEENVTMNLNEIDANIIVLIRFRIGIIGESL